MCCPAVSLDYLLPSNCWCNFLPWMSSVYITTAQDLTLFNSPTHAFLTDSVLKKKKKSVTIGLIWNLFPTLFCFLNLRPPLVWLSRFDMSLCFLLPLPAVCLVLLISASPWVKVIDAKFSTTPSNVCLSCRASRQSNAALSVPRCVYLSCGLNLWRTGPKAGFAS